MGGAPIATGGAGAWTEVVRALLHLNKRLGGYGRMAYTAGVRMEVYGRCGCTSVGGPRGP